jgi:adenosylcobinamide-GDP ribazoletransferase
VSKALAFLTPLGRPTRPDAGALPWFPVVGAVIGLVLGGLWWALARIWPPGVAAAIVVGADLAATGMLHVDGLLDAADGLFLGQERPRRLEVMREPTVGAFGVAVAVATLVVRWAALAAIAPTPRVTVALWAASRGLMAGTVALVPYARPLGLASAFVQGDPRSEGLVGAGLGLFIGLGVAGWWRPIAGPVSVVAGLAAGAAVIGLAKRRLGGFTGDVLGAACVVSETVGLVAAAARW